MSPVAAGTSKLLIHLQFRQLQFYRIMAAWSWLSWLFRSGQPAAKSRSFLVLGVGFFHKSWEWKYPGFHHQSFLRRKPVVFKWLGAPAWSDISSMPSTYSRDGHQQTSSYEVRCRNRHCHYQGSFDAMDDRARESHDFGSHFCG